MGSAWGAGAPQVARRVAKQQRCGAAPESGAREKCWGGQTANEDWEEGAAQLGRGQAGWPQRAGPAQALILNTGGDRLQEPGTSGSYLGAAERDGGARPSARDARSFHGAVCASAGEAEPRSCAPAVCARIPPQTSPTGAVPWQTRHGPLAERAAPQPVPQAKIKKIRRSGRAPVRRETGNPTEHTPADCAAP